MPWETIESKPPPLGKKNADQRKGQTDPSKRTPVRPLILDLGCCGVSALQIGAPRYALPGFDGGAYDVSAKQAGILVVAGRISPPLAPHIRSLYERLGDPKWIIAFGTCAISGAIWHTIPLGQIIPIDILIPGCPPHTDALMGALAQLASQRSR
jgi:NADH-quinone oxidoreductase subunit B